MKQTIVIGTYQDILDYMMLGYEPIGTCRAVIDKRVTLLFNRKIHISLYDYDGYKCMDLQEIMTRNDPPGLIYIP